MKFIFCDIDGVLNTTTSVAEAHLVISGANPHKYNLEPTCVAALNSITDRTGAQIIISSTWRIGHTLHELQTCLRQQGVTGLIVDKTPRLRGQSRGEEINHYLMEHLAHHSGEQVRFVILDDSCDFDKIMTRFLIRTYMTTGLTQELADQATSLLLLDDSLQIL